MESAHIVAATEVMRLVVMRMVFVVGEVMFVTSASYFFTEKDAITEVNISYKLQLASDEPTVKARRWVGK